MADLEKAASVLASSGPHKYEATPKRIRVVAGSQVIFDALDALLVWEHPYYPQYYLPTDTLKNATLGAGRAVDGAKGYQIHDLTTKGDSTTTIKDAILSIETGPLANYLRPSVGQMETFFEEDEPVQGHPVDPYKRIDTRRSSRPIRVAVDGVEVASAPWSVHLYETGLPVRYYLPRTSVDPKFLKDSDTSFYCPYKGRSSYFHIEAKPGAEPAKDVVWYYKAPMLAVEAIRDLVCFYNEKVDIWIDGNLQQRPKTHFA